MKSPHLPPYAPPHLPLQGAVLPLDLLGQIGQAVAQSAHDAQEHWPAAPSDAAAALADLEQLGLRLQEVVRVLAAPVRTGLEPCCRRAPSGRRCCAARDRTGWAPTKAWR
jgi:hypothetical protein